MSMSIVPLMKLLKSVARIRCGELKNTLDALREARLYLDMLRLCGKDAVYPHKAQLNNVPHSLDYTLELGTCNGNRQ